MGLGSVLWIRESSWLVHLDKASHIIHLARLCLREMHLTRSSHQSHLVLREVHRRAILPRRARPCVLQRTWGPSRSLWREGRTRSSNCSTPSSSPNRLQRARGRNNCWGIWRSHSWTRRPESERGSQSTQPRRLNRNIWCSRKYLWNQKSRS